MITVSITINVFFYGWRLLEYWNENDSLKAKGRLLPRPSEDYDADAEDV